MLGADDSRRIRKSSLKQEKRTANTYRGSRQPGSGSGWMRKNDVRSDRLIIENKTTDNKRQYSIKSVDLVELTERAILEDRLPVLQFDLGGRRYVVLNEDDFLEMIGE